MARALNFLIKYFSNYYTLHRSDLAARAAPLDHRLLFLKSSIIAIQSLSPDQFKISRFKGPPGIWPKNKCAKFQQNPIIFKVPLSD